MQTTNYWTDLTPAPIGIAENELQTEVDVAIIGGGITGLSAARILAKSGANVAVLEQNTMGWGASSRNGGIVTTGLKQKISVVLTTYGEALGREFWQASVDAVELIDEIVREEQIDCDYVRKGHLALAYKPSHFDSMREQIGWFKKTLNHDLYLVSPDEIRSEIGSDAFYGGQVDELSGGIDPARYVFGLARAAAIHGALLCEHTTVERVAKVPAGFQVQTNRGVINAGEVVVAANGYLDMSVPKMKHLLFPVGSYIIVTEPLDLELQRRLDPKGRMFYDSKWFLNYFRLTPDGRMLFGGRNNLSVDLDLHESARLLSRQMLRVFPELRDVPLTHTWSGNLGITFDLMPHIGRVDGIHYVFGYGGHGVSFATYLGTEMGLLLTGAKKRSPFAEIRHQTMFFYRRKPWFLPLASAYFRVLDWLT